jgi:galactokinase
MLPRLESFANKAWVSERLQTAGLAEYATGAKAALFAQCAQVLRRHMPDPPSSTAWFVPGRIEVLGKHTDYAGGRSIVASVERGFCCLAVPSDDSRVRVVDIVRNEEIDFGLEPTLKSDSAGWGNYARTAARRLVRNFPGANTGCFITLASDLPSAAGMSSSSALIIALFLVLADVNHIWERAAFKENIQTLEDLAGYLGTVENGQSFHSLEGDRGVGTFGGSEDHTAILCSQAGEMAQYSYCPVSLERRIRLPEDLIFVIGSSGVEAQKTGAARDKYNQISELVSQLTALWKAKTGGDQDRLADILGHDRSSHYKRLVQLIHQAELATNEADRLMKRLQHFHDESCVIIPRVPDDLTVEANRLLFQRLVDQSQQSGATLLRNQIPETVYLATAARGLGALAASAFGAGFGGSVWALTPRETAETLCDKWAEAYQREYPLAAENAEFFVTAAGPAALRPGQNRVALSQGDDLP